MFTETISHTETAHTSVTVKAMHLDRADCWDSDPASNPVIVSIVRGYGEEHPVPAIHATEEEIEEYLFGRLPHAEAAALRQHVSKCNECAQMFQKEMESVVLIRGVLQRFDWSRKSDDTKLND